MSTEKKAAEPFDLEKLAETVEGQLAGGFSDALDAENLSELPDINISKCYCGTTPTQPASK